MKLWKQFDIDSNMLSSSNLDFLDQLHRVQLTILITKKYEETS
jgi:hypothetical protein